MPLSTISNGDSSATARAAINAAIAQLNATIPTGTRKTGYWTDPGAGWVLANCQTIGNAGSGADRDNADTEELFFLLWEMWNANYLLNSSLFDSSGASATPTTAAADFAAGCRLTTPDERMRVAVMKQDGGMLSSWNAALGLVGGQATVELSIGELPAHSHTFGYTSNETDNNGNGSTISRVSDVHPNGGISTGIEGGNLAHNNVQPFISVNVAIKL